MCSEIRRGVGFGRRAVKQRGGVETRRDLPYLSALGFHQGMAKTMGLRTKITDGIKVAMREKDSARLGTLRLINAAVKDQDIAARGKGNSDGVGEGEVLAILGKMVKQRQESARSYEEAGRLELAEGERSEIAIIEEYLPRQLDDGEVDAAIKTAISDVGAESLRDMGKVMAALKGKYTGQMDFGSVGPRVKDQLGA